MQHSKNIRQLIVVSLLGLILTLILSGITAWYVLLHQTKAEITALSQETLYTVEEYLTEAQDLLDKTLQRDPQDCSLKSREVFIPELLSAVVVTDILYTLPDKTLCSLTYGDNIKAISKKSLVTNWQGVQFFILADDVLAAGKGNILVGKKGVFALLPQRQLAGFHVTGQEQRTQLHIMINNELLVHSASSTAPDNRWLIISKIADSGLRVEFSVPLTALRSFWLHSFWPAQWVINLLLLLSYSTFFYCYARHKLSMKKAIRRALQKGNFCLHYQPIVEIKTGQIQSLEALIRWPTTSGNAIPADVFIPVAEQTGLICSITQYVLHQVMIDLSVLHQTHPKLMIAVNISAADLSAADFATALRTQCAAYALSPHYLKLEITERSLVDDENAKRNMLSLSEEGFMLVLDDFGTGYSSLSYLNKLPVQTLKIDRSFILGLGMNIATGSVVPQIVSMAQQLNMQVIAEGVETAEQAQALLDLDVPYAQGWLYDKAMPLADIHKKLIINQQQPYSVL